MANPEDTSYEVQFKIKAYNSEEKSVDMLKIVLWSCLGLAGFIIIVLSIKKISTIKKNDVK